MLCAPAVLRSRCTSSSPRRRGLALVAQRALAPSEIMMGCVWLGPVPGLPATLNQNRGQDAANAVVTAALRAGIQDFDTAPLYGLGASEERLGTALRHACKELNLPLPGTPGKQGEGAPQVFTKIGRLIREPESLHGKPCPPGFEEPTATPLEERVIVNDYTGNGVCASLGETIARMNMSSLQAVHTLRVHDPNDNDCNPAGNDEVSIAALPRGVGPFTCREH